MYAARGFTLLELVIVLIISMLLITIGIPGFQTLIQNNRLTAAASSIKNNLLFARNQSVSYLNYVTVCPLESNVCTNNWISGIDIFIDSNRNGSYDSGEVLLKTGDKFNSNDTLVFPSSSITYTPDGQITGSSAIFRYCTGDERIGVSVAYSGRPKTISGETFSNCN
ncbi:general secretion pathway protein GspH [Psychromonas sp. psych-6C06]|uniref:GspH/FimT family pseudopilin n=1 Tax=Psychromonas sp. psych-6C06 TaxID=2058089 RepID=UPI000C330EBE|nr:GspH/FimT family pseudopilin [Psychromonas sp. psych-6C06]PKF61216.1 general secretion pathway protein GspH [Psychromonas sp. psych-6C06]